MEHSEAVCVCVGNMESYDVELLNYLQEIKRDVCAFHGPCAMYRLEKALGLTYGMRLAFKLMHRVGAEGECIYPIVPYFNFLLCCDVNLLAYIDYDSPCCQSLILYEAENVGDSKIWLDTRVLPLVKAIYGLQARDSFDFLLSTLLRTHSIVEGVKKILKGDFGHFFAGKFRLKDGGMDALIALGFPIHYVNDLILLHRFVNCIIFVW